MDNNYRGIIDSCQEWERQLALSMCFENIEVLKKELGVSPDMQDADVLDRFHAERDRMVAEAIGIIREVTVDSDGETILSPAQWLDKVAGLSDAERQALGESKCSKITDRRNGFSYDVPASLTGHFVRLFEVGIRHAAATSGRMADEAGRRTDQGIPYALTAVARPLARVTFDIREDPGVKERLTAAQKKDIITAATEAGWSVEDWNGRFLSLVLPVSKSGKTVSALDAAVRNRLNTQQPRWYGSDGCVQIYFDAFRSQLIAEGGRVVYSDRDLTAAWDRLTDAIVQVSRRRWQQESPRVTDIQVRRTVDTGQMSVNHDIRCRIDGQWQMYVPLHKLDGGRYDTAVHRAGQGDTDALQQLKKELAVTYFSDALSLDAKAERGMKR